MPPELAFWEGLAPRFVGRKPHAGAPPPPPGGNFVTDAVGNRVTDSGGNPVTWS